MKRKRRRGRKHKARVSEARPARMDVVYLSELPRLSGQVIERSSLATAGEPAERHRHVAAELKRITAIGGTLFVVLIILYLLLG